MQRLIGLTSCLVVMTSLLWSQRRPMTVDDALDMVNVGDVRLSPDGQWVAYNSMENGSMNIYVKSVTVERAAVLVSSGPAFFVSSPNFS